MISASAGSGCASAQQELHTRLPFRLHDVLKKVLQGFLFAFRTTYLAGASTSILCETLLVIPLSVWLGFVSEPLETQNNFLLKKKKKTKLLGK